MARFGAILVLVAVSSVLLASIERAHASPGSVVTRVGGKDRFATAAAMAKLTFNAADEVLLARGDVFADRALAGLLAGNQIPALPVLLTTHTTIPGPTLDALSSLRPARIRIVGGDAAVSDAVAGDLRRRGYDVSRVGGVDRADTARLVARLAPRLGIDDQGQRTAIVAGWDATDDVAIASPMVFAAHLPLLFAGRELPAATVEAIAELRIEHVVVVGSNSAVSRSAAAALSRLPTVERVERLSGAGPSATARAVATWTADHLGFSVSTVILAAAGSFDGIVLDAQPHRSQIVVLPVSRFQALGAEDCLVLRDWGPKVQSLRIVGGTAAVTDGVASAAASCAGAEDVGVHSAGSG